MELNGILTRLLKQKAIISRRAFSIALDIPTERVSLDLIATLQELLRDYNRAYRITIRGIPPCLLLQARNQIIYTPAQNTVHRIPACRRCSLKEACPGFPRDNALASITARPVADTPSEIVLEITGQCNLGCGHCTSATQNARHVPFKTIKTIIDNAKRYGIPAVRFTGGEPLLHPDFSKMLLYAKARGFYVLLNTNATLITPALMRTITRTVDNVLVSLQGFDSSSERALTRSPVPFLKKIQNLFLLRAFIPVVRIGTVITPTLLDSWPQYAALIKRIHPAVWELFRPMGDQGQGASQLTVHDYRKLALDVLRLKKGGINVKLANALPFCIFPEQLIESAILLGALSDDGHSRLIWDLRGFFKPSYFIEKNLGKTIKDAWRHPFLKKIRGTSYLPGRCRTCLHLPQCLGGSRAMAFRAYRSYFAPDPFFVPPQCRRLKTAE